MNLLEHQGRSRDVVLLDIRLDDEVIILRGPPTEASGAYLKGTLTLCLQHSLAIRGIKLELLGVERLQWQEMSTTKLRTVKHDGIVYRKEWGFMKEELFLKKTVLLEAGNYEWPFQVIIPGSQAESVEGLRDAHIIYKMKATIERPKWYREITTKKHLRIVRTLNPGTLELSSTMSVENSWPNKCDYSISIPHKACVFGTQVPLDISILPLLKGLEIGKINCTLEEYHTFVVPSKGKKKTDQRRILEEVFTHGSFEDEADGVGEQTGRWFMHAVIHLPKSLTKCVQDCEVGMIKVRHKLRVQVQLLNPDGHTSELRASLPVQIFISPNLLMGEDNVIHADLPSDATLLHDAATPPRYDEHIYDRLWDGLPQESFITPLPSGANTPEVLSRNSSVENLVAPNHSNAHSAASSRPRSRATSPEGTSTGLTSPEELSVDELRASLSAAHGSDYFLMGGSRRDTRSVGNTRPGSPQFGYTNNLITANLPDVAELSRVPSYQTAVRAGTRSLATNSSLPELPLYENEPRSEPSTPPVGLGLAGLSSRPITPPSRGRGRFNISLRNRHPSPQGPDL